MGNEEQVVLVNNKDEEVGVMGKMEAHKNGILHQAISIIIFNTKGEMLLQQRAEKKYHWANIWSNAVCTHPRKGESHKKAAERRLVEELGISTGLKEIFSFIYKAFDEESGLTEHEYDHVFIGKYDGLIPFNTDEVKTINWISIDDLTKDVNQNPEKYSFWFKIILKEMNSRKLLDNKN